MDERPTAHQLRAAIRVARLIDETGNWIVDARSSYRLAATEGEHPAASLEGGQQLLLHIGLVAMVEDQVIPTPALRVIAALADDTAAEALALRFDSFAGLHDSDRRVEVGVAGEEAVAEACRADLRLLNRSDLADRVQRVSLISDALGYDIIAPTVVGRVRALEVKTTTSTATDHFRFFISRNEFDVGRSGSVAWALIACRSLGDGSVDILGWCRVDALRAYLPDDGVGRWTEALVRLPIAALMAGLPPAV